VRSDGRVGNVRPASYDEQLTLISRPRWWFVGIVFTIRPLSEWCPKRFVNSGDLAVIALRRAFDRALRDVVS
jgi:hypothetical protein